jgi:glycosyltransferase involved in cell wall biosynthesis
MCDNAGLDYTYVPHGIETTIYKPEDRTKAREITKLPADAFIIGMIAANKGAPSRKGFQQQFEAFKEFHAAHKDTILYVHTAKAEHGENGGVNLGELAAYLGLREGIDIFFPDQYQNLMGFPDEYVNSLYNSFDVLSSVSMGEGFGIPIVEAQSAGCPVIVGDWTAMSELCFSGWAIPKGEAEPVWTPIGAYQYSVHSHALAQRFEVAYTKKNNLMYRERARKGALEYDADAVYKKYWQPTLAAIADKIANEPKRFEDALE